MILDIFLRIIVVVFWNEMIVMGLIYEHEPKGSQ